MLAKKSFNYILTVFLLVLLCSSANAQSSYYDGLLKDIPEPPESKAELPSPIPMVYQFMGAMMDGDFDVCLSNFDVDTFLRLIYGRNLNRMDKSDLKELYSYQVQTHRNEFRFLAKVMHRVAEGARIDYSNPRYHKKIQSKVVVRLDTNRGRFDFEVYCCFLRDRWYVYDYVLNNQRLTQTFRESLKGVSVNQYLTMLRPFYNDKISFRPFKNEKFDFSMQVPRNFELKEKISDALLATLSAFDGRFLLHVQAATYEKPQNLSQVGELIKTSLTNFQPRLYDQWKGELAGVEVGNILFHFMMGERRLFAHMVLIPLGKKLVVLNFYHSSLQMMKHMTNLRDKMLRSMSLPKLEAMGGILPGEIPDELTIDNNDFAEDESLEVDSSSMARNNDSWESTPATQVGGDFGGNDNSNDDNEEDYEQYSSYTDDDQPEELTPNTYTNEESGSSYEPSGDDEDYIPPAPTSGYGDGHFGDDDDSYPGDNGSEVSF